jgi:glycosyltransferase involved in cell wall biosynthesis
MTVLALLAASEITGPCRGLFQLVEQTKDKHVTFVLGMFLVEGHRTAPAIEEARRRGFHVEILLQRGRYDPRLVTQALSIIRRVRPAVIQSHGYKSALLSLICRGLTRIPWVAFSHGYTDENYRVSLYNRMDRRLLRRADRVVAVSGAMAGTFARNGIPTERLRVVHNAVEPADHRIDADGSTFRRFCGAATGDLLVGVIGRLSPEKGHSVFIEAFAQVAACLPSAKAVLVGEGPERPRLDGLVREAGMTGRIVLAGHRGDVSDVYAAVDLVVIPSWSEGLPNVLLEAMLHGKAVVATEVGGVPEVLRKAGVGWLVKAGDALQLGRAITAALGDAERRQADGRKGAAYVRAHYSPARRADDIINIYREVTGASFGA